MYNIPAKVITCDYANASSNGTYIQRLLGLGFGILSLCTREKVLFQNVNKSVLTPCSCQSPYGVNFNVFHLKFLFGKMKTTNFFLLKYLKMSTSPF